MNPRIKRLQNPTFKDSDLVALNPILAIGEIVFIISETTTDVENFKVGDGVNVYTALPFKDISSYPYNDLVTNTIGDIKAGDNLAGRLQADIIKDMVSPYIAPVVSGVQNNAAGSYASTAIMEIGQSIGAAISVLFSVSNPENLVATPMEVLASQFEVANPYPNAAIALTPDGVISPTAPVSYTIGVRAIHNNGTTGYSNSYIQFNTRFIWGASPLSDLTTNQHALDLIANGGDQRLQQNYGNEYQIGVAGYGFVLIPSILVTGPIVWTDVTDPNSPASLEMINMGTLSVNNGVGTYNYEKFRTPFNNLEGSTLRAV